MASARENDLNPDIKIGLELPFARSRTGLFGLTETTLEQAGHNIKNLLLTAKGERIMQPDFGSGLRSLLFEQMDDTEFKKNIQQTILKSVEYWLPYIRIEAIDVDMASELKDKNQVNLNLQFTVGNDIDLQEITLVVQE